MEYERHSVSLYNRGVSQFLGGVSFDNFNRGCTETFEERGSSLQPHRPWESQNGSARRDYGAERGSVEVRSNGGPAKELERED